MFLGFPRMLERFMLSFILVCVVVSSFSVGRAETFTSSTILAEATQAALEIDTIAIRVDPLQEIARNYVLSNDVEGAERTIQKIGKLHSFQPPSICMRYGTNVTSM